MQTKCYAIGCKKHPLHEKRHDLKRWLTGWSVGHLIIGDYDELGGADVDCLEPESDFFDEMGKDPEDYEFPITAYGDGLAITGFSETWGDVEALCDAEEHED